MVQQDLCKSVVEMLGVQSVTTRGMPLMLKSYATSWALQEQVH